MSFSTVKSAAMEGLAVEIVYVEADVSNGLPIFHMVGYLSSEVKEAAERVRSAVRNSGLEFPAKRVVINLSPATMRKRGASFDLPIAVAILTSLGVLQQNRRLYDHRRTRIGWTSKKGSWDTFYGVRGKGTKSYKLYCSERK